LSRKRGGPKRSISLIYSGCREYYFFAIDAMEPFPYTAKIFEFLEKRVGKVN